MTLILALDFGGTKLAAGTVEFEPFPYLRFASDLYSIQKQFYQSYYQDND
ncbi:hypothetical protein [Cylindrospermopsis raciborskii]|nr:hypothetical protein [Cylindrospermopsis raciborskii]MCZ2202647.1 hypothetical protein [Cylindrospermopsis raciborskii PAMP2012]MCZ2206666.1 hypothetical protein [Cylindrospermopsis raciborskii PAMP2011]